MDLHPPDVPVPEEVRTERVWLRPLSTTDVELDFDAVTSSAPMLRAWSQSDWPADGFSPVDNLADLERHEREHLERRAFTFTVMNPEGTRCLGCVYLEPVWPEERPLCDGARVAAHVGFWVRTSEIPADLDRHLLATLRSWIQDEWAFERVVFSISTKDERQRQLLADAGLERRLEFSRDGRRCVAFT
jgi:hypothetical protein